MGHRLKTELSVLTLTYNNYTDEDNEHLVSSGDVSFNDTCFSEWIGCLGLTSNDKTILSTNACLSACHVLAASKLLKVQFPNQNGLQDTSYLLEKSVWNSQPDQFVQIIFVNSGHWACLSNVFCKDEGTVDLYDSAHTAPRADDSTVKQAKIIFSLQKKAKPVKINLINVSLQYGGTDCGLFAIAMATDLANRVDPCTVKYSQELMRTHLSKCFERLKLTRFRSQPREIKAKILCIFKINTKEDVSACKQGMYMYMYR